jgi:hypothetical protein
MSGGGCGQAICRCGHPEPDHDYLTYEELAALTKNDIEWGPCEFWDVSPQKNTEGETLCYIWAAFKPGQLHRIADHVISARSGEAEDPCDTDFMREIST